MCSKIFSGVTGLWWATAASPLRILWAWTLRGCSDCGLEETWGRASGDAPVVKDKLVK